jgi:hypothetical protein
MEVMLLQGLGTASPVRVIVLGVDILSALCGMLRVAVLVPEEEGSKTTVK